jgi:cell division protein FtsA
MAVRRAGLEVADLVVEPFASAAAVLSEPEIEAGVALVDIGGGTTDICLFEDGFIRHTAIISIGGDRITKDIQEAFGIMKEQAEIVKVNYGSCYPTESMKNEVVVVPGLPGRKPKEISLFSIAQVIQARMMDIIEKVDYEIELSGHRNRLGGGMVLTGGGSAMQNIAQLFTFHTGLEIHIGMPSQKLSKGMVDEVRNPMYSTGIGLVLKGFEISERQNIPGNELIPTPKEEVVNEKKVKTDKKPFMDLFSGAFGIGKGIKDWMKDGEDFNEE